MIGLGDGECDCREAGAGEVVDAVLEQREALAEARRLGRLPADSPIVEWPEEDDSLLGVLLNLVGLHTSVGELTGALPAALLPFAQLLAPFLIFEPSKPLARAEFSEEIDGDGREPRE